MKRPSKPLKSCDRMEVHYLISSLMGVIVGVATSWFEGRWMKTKRIDFRFHPIRFILFALILGLAFPLLVHQYGIEVKTVVYALLASILCAIALIDIDTAKIPNKLVLAGIVVWGLTVWFIAVPENDFNVGTLFVPLFGQGFFSVMIDSLLAAVIVGGLLLVFSVVYEQVTGRPSLGGGDIKLLFMIALYAGLTGSVFNLFLSCLFGLVLGFVWNLTGKKHKLPEIDAVSPGKTKTFPFGPAIAMSTIVTLVFGPTLIGPFL